MSYEIALTPEAESDLEKHKLSGDKKILIKISKLFDELREHPATGTGKPELLKYYDIPTWSRRITAKHRLIYRIENQTIIVLILSLWGHYDDR
jgi:toxin YoeB